MERSLVLVKPDGVQRALVGEVISRLERRGLRLVCVRGRPRIHCPCFEEAKQFSGTKRREVGMKPTLTVVGFEGGNAATGLAAGAVDTCCAAKRDEARDPD